MIIITPAQLKAGTSALAFLAVEGIANTIPAGDFGLLDVSGRPWRVNGQVSVPSVLLDADPTGVLQAATKQYVDATAGVILGSSAVAVSLTGTTTATAMVTLTVPANAMGANGWIEVEAQATVTGSTNNKRLRLTIAGTTVATWQTVTATVLGARVYFKLRNRNAANSQISLGAGMDQAGWGETTVGPQANAIDTTIAQTLTLTGLLASTGDTITVEDYSIRVFYRP